MVFIYMLIFGFMLRHYALFSLLQSKEQGLLNCLACDVKGKNRLGSALVIVV